MKLVLLTLVLAVCFAAPQKGKKSDVEVLEAKSRRGENTIAIDGKLRISAEKPLKGLILAFDFLGDSGDVLTTQKTEIADDTLARGEEPTFHAETNNPPGAIKYRIRAFDGGDRELRIANAGPFVIE